MSNYQTKTSTYADGNTMVEVLLPGADKTLANYGVVHRFRAADGRSMHAWSIVSGQNGIEHRHESAVKKCASTLYRLRPGKKQG